MDCLWAFKHFFWWYDLCGRSNSSANTDSCQKYKIIYVHNVVDLLHVWQIQISVMTRRKDSSRMEKSSQNRFYRYSVTREQLIGKTPTETKGLYFNGFGRQVFFLRHRARAYLSLPAVRFLWRRNHPGPWMCTRCLNSRTHIVFLRLIIEYQNTKGNEG